MRKSIKYIGLLIISLMLFGCQTQSDMTVSPVEETVTIPIRQELDSFKETKTKPETRLEESVDDSTDQSNNNDKLQENQENQEEKDSTAADKQEIRADEQKNTITEYIKPEVEHYNSNIDVWALTGTIEEKIEGLRDVFPHNYYWNHVGLEGKSTDYPMSVTNTPCRQHLNKNQTCNGYESILAAYYPYGKYNIQCLAFANMVSDIFHGKETPYTTHSDVEAIKVGDVIRLTKATHSVVVIGVTDSTITVLEVNGDWNTCKIEWDRIIDKSNLMDFVVFSR